MTVTCKVFEPPSYSCYNIDEHACSKLIITAIGPVLADCVRNMPILGGLGAYPPENFEKLDPLRLNLRVCLTVY